MLKTDYSARKEALKRLLATVTAREEEIYAALARDLGKCREEACLTEVSVLKNEIRHILRHLRKWMKPVRVKTVPTLFPSRCYQVPEPYGRVLIMAPWNYPLLLTLEPLVGALAAGNSAVLKPSAYSPATSEVIARIVREALPEEVCRVVLGGRAENTGLLEQRFDYIFFTGGVKVGQVVMEAAARHLTPLTLELGGKSPVIVEKTADVDLAAKRITFGKFTNAGQTCVAPDYILVDRSLETALTEALKKWLRIFYPVVEQDGCLRIEDYPRIITPRHFQRLTGLMHQDGRILYGGQSREDLLTIFPTLITGVDDDSAIMQEEIFGPLLPIIPYDRLDEAMEAVRRRPKPLALYLFTRDRPVKEKVLHGLSYGGGCINDCLLHVGSSTLPFGGVGQSGMGAYHGKASFDTFTHYKSIVEKGRLLDIPVRYRPYKKSKKKLISLL